MAMHQKDTLIPTFIADV